jgi:hypothetical protein
MRAQFLYRAEELGDANAYIGSIAIYVIKPTDYPMHYFFIRMKQTPKAGFEPTGEYPYLWSWDNEDWTNVYVDWFNYEGENAGQVGWHVFNLDPPFYYDGLRNLMVEFSFNNAARHPGSSAEVRATRISGISPMDFIPTIYFGSTILDYQHPINWGSSGLTIGAQI